MRKEKAADKVNLRRRWRKLCSDADSFRRIPEPRHDLGNGKKNVLILISKPGGGGAERVACFVASGLAETCNVTMLCLHEYGNAYPLDERVQRFCIPHFAAGLQRLERIQYVRAVKKKFRIDISISFLYLLNLLNVFSKGKERVIVSERNNPKLNAPKKFPMTRVLYAMADLVIFQTREVQDMYGKRVKKHSVILPNPVSVSCVASGVRKKKIVHAARLHPNKNQELLLRAFAKFLPAHPQYTLDIYGAGEMETELKALSQRLGLGEHAVFHGNVSDIHEQMADAGMFVLSSNVEGMPNALLEAMMMGLPCISTKCTGAKEVMENGVNGLLVDIGDVTQMAEAMARMADHEEFARQCGRAAVRTAGRFEKKVVLARWQEAVTAEKVKTFLWKDMRWESARLTPGIILPEEKNQKQGKAEKPADIVTLRRGKDIVLQASEGSGKVTDCGSDRMTCIYAGIPGQTDFSLEAEITVMTFLREPGPNNREAFGIFARDTVKPDSFTGEYYSNMAAVGGYYGRYNFFGRDGLCPGANEGVNNFFLYSGVNRPGGVFEEQPLYYHIREDKPIRLRISLRKKGSWFFADMTTPEGEDLLDPLRNGGETELAAGKRVSGREGSWSAFLPNALCCRDRDRYYLGFFAADGSKICIHTDTFRLNLTGEEMPEREEIPGTIPDEKEDRKEEGASFCPDNQDREEKALLTGGGEKIWMVSPEGRSDGEGTEESPLSLEAAIKRSGPGDTVRLKSGRYCLSESVIIGKKHSGTAEKRKTLTGETGLEKGSGNGSVILDFEDSSHSLVLGGDYWDVSGIGVTRGNGFFLSGSHNRIRNCRAFRNRETGFQIRYPEIAGSKEFWPSDNLVEDCVSFENRDPAECNADGFACKVAAGAGNCFRNCTAWLNSDDGFDLFAKNREIGAVRIEHCRSYLNGYRLTEDGSIRETAGNGNGFKLGGSGLAISHEVADSIAEGNRLDGFTSNSNPYLNLYRCRSGNNGNNNYSYYYYAGSKILPNRNIVDCRFEDRDGFSARELLGCLSTEFGIKKE